MSNLLFTIGNLLKSTNIDTKTTTQASHKVQGPISWYFSIEHDKIINCCSTCPNKIVTSKQVTEIDLYPNIIDPPGKPSRPGGLFLDIVRQNLINWTTFALHVLTKDLPVKSYENWLISTQNRLSSRRPVSWYRSIDLNKLNNICSTCLYKIFTSEKLLKSNNIDKKSTLQASHWYLGPISWYHSIELDKLNNVCSICLYKIFTRKKLLISKNFDKL